MSDLISRDDAIEAIDKLVSTMSVCVSTDECRGMNWMKQRAIKAIESLPSAENDEWCDNCKEYDHNKHCCPRFNRVIRETVEEVKQNAEQKWIPCKERLPICLEDVLVWVKDVGVLIGFLSYEDDWEDDSIGWVVGKYNSLEKGCYDYSDFDLVEAWMPLPSPFQESKDEKCR